MADLQDISVYLKTQAALAVYPNGISQSSIVPRGVDDNPNACMDIRVFEGWPLRELLEADLGGVQLFNGQLIPRANGKAAQVSVFPYGRGSTPREQILDNTYVIVPPVHGMTVSIGSDQATVTIGGGPAGPNEFVTIIVGQQFVASVAAGNGGTVQSIITQLVSQLSGNVAGITSTSTSITIPNQAYITARVGSVATLGKVTHKQCQQFMVTCWCPDHTSRGIIAAAVDNLIKQNIRVTMPDTSQATILGRGTFQDDQKEPMTCYRRDLVYEAEYATVQQFNGYEITSVAMTISEMQNIVIPFVQDGIGLVPNPKDPQNTALPTAPFNSTTKVV